MITIDQLEQLRAETPGCTRVNHLNNAGSALPPLPVLDIMVEYLQYEALTGGYEAAADFAGAIQGFYDNTSKLINARPAEIAFAYNATDAYNRALSSIPLESGDVILTTTDDYVSNQLAFLYLKKHKGIEVLRARQAANGGVDVSDLVQLMDAKKPKVVAVTHVPTSSGLVQPVYEIGKHCRERNVWYLVDACQSAGQLPLDVQSMGCDFLSATFRKFLRGPRGAGFLYTSQRVLDQGLEPAYPDLRGSQWTGADTYLPGPDAKRFELWEKSYATVLGSSAAAKYANKVGMDAIAHRVQHLAAQLRKGLSGIPGVRVLDQGPELCGIVTFYTATLPLTEIKDALRQRGINAATGSVENAVIDLQTKGVPGIIRLSPHYYNTEGEIDQVVFALQQILK